VTPEFRIRCSSLATIMTDPKSIDPALLNTPELAALAAKKVKTPEDQAILAPLFDRSLSAGAKTYLNDIAKEFIYGYNNVVSSKYTTKGTIVEDESIALYNELFGTFYAKNTERKVNAWLTGECDIDTGEEIIDIKSSWSIPTFPELPEDGHKNDYEWQVRGYMMLWNRERAKVAYCLVDTPDELIGFENPEIHDMSRLKPNLRVTIVEYERDRAKEERIIRRCEAAFAYVAERIERVHAAHCYPQP
jgi:hypothetical protein